MKHLAIIGSTGSIGCQALEVVARYPGSFAVSLLVARGSRPEVLQRQIDAFYPQLVLLTSRSAEREMRSRLRVPAGTQVIFTREDSWEPGQIRQALAAVPVDLVLNAFSGVAGLGPSLAALELGRTLALANKESLVVGGRLVLEEATRHGVPLIPVDSEHSAIFQCLQGQARGAVSRIILTASGGPFRSFPVAEMGGVTPEMALAHPTWQMGPKVTVDSATMMNKGLEVIEATWLFGLRPEQVEVVVHPESIVHSLVAFADGSVLAQMARPDMRLPIQYALTYPERWPGAVEYLDLAQVGLLHFAPLQREKFPCFDLALAAARQGSTYPAVLNAADEVAVEMFLAGEIGFTEIPRLIEKVLEEHVPVAEANLAAIKEADAWARERAASLAGK
ncbi:MAG: 1-deoxy-D-xylulose-5-phosphate reductoisomerase [Clostridia bacterium]|nr:MAG: 1-deoxy-D-xylulose-5-phosphate reductoisomerase [Clostridia bacterium]